MFWRLEVVRISDNRVQLTVDRDEYKHIRAWQDTYEAALNDELHEIRVTLVDKNAKDKAYPEHEKKKQVQEEWRTVLRFLEWLEVHCGYEVCQRTTSGGHPFESITQKPLQLMAQFFDVDLRKLEDERVRMLDIYRNETEINKKPSDSSEQPDIPVNIAEFI